MFPHLSLGKSKYLKSWLEIILLVGIITISGFLILYHRNEVPIDNDVAVFLLESTKTTKKPFTFGLQSHSNIMFWYYRLFHGSLLTTVYASGAWGIIFILTFYKFLKQYFGQAGAIGATTLLSTLPYFLVIGGSGLELTLPLAFLGISLLLISSAKQKLLRFFLAGITSGIGLYFYPGAWIGPLLLIVNICLWTGGWKKIILKVGLVVTGVLITYGPQVYLNVGKANLFWGRMNQVSYLNQIKNETLFDIIKHLLLSLKPFFFNIGGYVIFFNHTPFLPPLLGLTSLIGFGVLVKHNWKMAIFVSCWFLIGSLTAGFLTSEIAGSRYFLIMPSLFIPIAILIKKLTEVSTKKIAVLVGLLIISLININQYWDFHFNKLENSDFNKEFLWRSGKTLASLPAVTDIFFLQSGSLTSRGYHTFYWLVKDKKISDIHDLPNLKPGSAAVIVKSRLTDLEKTANINQKCNLVRLDYWRKNNHQKTGSLLLCQ